MSLQARNIPGAFTGLGVERNIFKGMEEGSVPFILENFFSSVVKSLRDNLDRKIHYDSLLGQSIVFNSKIFGQKISFELSMNDYWEWVDKGRGETKGGKSKGQTLRQKLSGQGGWIARKPLQLPETYSCRRKLKNGEEKTYTYKYKNRIQANTALAFLISRKIHREGFKGNQFYSEIMTDSLISKLKTDIRKAARKDVEINIQGIIAETTK